jgi:hypothetical protein
VHGVSYNRTKEKLALARRICNHGDTVNNQTSNRMNILDTFLSKRGQFLSVVWQRLAKVHKSCVEVIEKRVVAHSIRAGVVYDNMANVQDKRESGELPAENAGLPWGVWFLFPHVIEHKGGYYFRFALNPGVSKFETTWLLNGVEVSRDSIVHLLLASELREDEMPDVITVKAQDIVSMS